MNNNQNNISVNNGNQVASNNNFFDNNQTPNTMSATSINQNINNNSQQVNQNQVVLGETQTNETPNQQQVILGAINNMTYADAIGDLNKKTPSNVDVNTTGSSNQFINTGNYSDTALDGMNVDGTYNGLQYMTPEDYVNDPAVQENINPDPEKKKTITITNELKTLIMLVAIIFIFIIILPPVVDFVKSFIYR